MKGAAVVAGLVGQAGLVDLVGLVDLAGQLVHPVKRNQKKL
jgi:hypothetical protein